jgi:glycosyltransferase involved in cell wall biosynthesis
MSGGLDTLYTVARMLTELGHSVALTSPGDAPGMTETGLPLAPWDRPGLCAEDLWCVPESWPNALAVGARSGARTVVYAQSWIFLLTALPAGVRWKQLPARFLAVSRPVRWFMEEVLETPVTEVLPPSVAPEFFHEGGRPADHVRIAWMPRKNKALAEHIRQVAEACLARRKDAPKVRWVPAHGLSRQGVAECFASSHIFLATAFPEGFGLPPLEAMASGCVPVGFTGFGGWEYMRNAAEGCAAIAEPMPHASEGALRNNPDAGESLFSGRLCLGPPYALPPTPWDANGIYVADGDILGAGLALARAIDMAHRREPAWEGMTRAARATAAAYGQEAQKARLARLWPLLLETVPGACRH